MAVSCTVKQLAGPLCGRRYEKEYQNKFRDCISFYYDGAVRFERFCYGESAGLVFGVWANMDSQGFLTYKQPLDARADQSALPRQLTQAEGNALWFDNQRWRWELVSEFSQDKRNGYSAFSVALGKLFGR